MSNPISRLQRTAAISLSLTALLGAACWLPLRGLGQELPERPKSTGQETTKQIPPANVTIEKKKTQSGNPLQISAGDDGSTGAAGQASLSHDPGDYRRTDNTSQKSATKSLPLFGYDIFRSARETVDAQRLFLRKQAIADVSGTDTKDTSIRHERTTDTQEPNDTYEPPLTPRRKAPRTNSDTSDNTDKNSTDSSDSGSNSSNSRRPRRKPVYTDNTDESDYSSDNGSSRRYSNNSRGNSFENGANTEADLQNAYSTPVGPIALLYRGIAASVPADYQLASGDELKIRVESPTLEAILYKKIVDARGAIQLDNIGDVVIRGQTISSAEKMLEIRLRPFYKNVRVSIETGRLRTMQILVSGAAYEPGTYTVPAVATAFNLINIAGGPTDDGSLRNIEVRRKGKKIATLDIYKMVIGDAQLTDIPLNAGDVILIPPRKSRITVSGEVLRPAIFELLPNETLLDALNYAGGVKASGLNQGVRINTVIPGAERIIKDVNPTDPELNKQPLYDGDTVEVFSVRNRLTNRVTVEGAVDQPNDYALMPGMRISDLVERARGPLSEAYLQKAELHRWQTDNTDLMIIVDLEKALAKDPKNNLELQKWDRLKVYTREEVAYTGRRKVFVDGAVKKPGVYDASINMHVSDLLRMAGGPTPDADLDKAHLFHHHDDGPDTHEYVNVAAAIKEDANKNPEVLDSDKLIVFTVQQASFMPENWVDIKGEVVNQGRYPRFAGMKLSDLLAFAGGFKPSAANGVVLAHARTVADAQTTKVVSIAFDAQRRCAPQDDVVLQDGDVVSVQGVGGYQPEVQSIKVVGAVNKPGIIFLRSKTMRLSDAIKEADGLRPEAFPQGAEFYRNPQMLATTGQRALVQDLAALNDLLNDSETNRERAKAQLELIKATGAAISDSTPLSALGGASSAAAAANPAANAVASNIAGSQLVTNPRKLVGVQLDPNGIIAVNLPDALLRPKSADDIILVDGDIIDIPEKPTTVEVVGAVNSKRGILYVPGKGLDYYIDLAGGFTVDAAKDRIVIFHKGGGVIPAKRVKELQPGDYIFVPPKVLAAKLSHGNGFDSFFRSLTSSAILFKLATGIFGI